ncbi:MAG: hypothetical protein M0P71_04060 [Melioribacteraceae bacterium]|nr:hypothetical protein [Melioribacteraceae bacterium]
MGQQQLLLIALGIIIVGIAIVVGVNLFQANAIEAKRNNIINESVNLAAMAQQYYMKPVAYGGGGRSFTGWTIPSELKLTANGHFNAETGADQVIITATGNEVVTGNDSVKVQVTVLPRSFQTVVIK